MSRRYLAILPLALIPILAAVILYNPSRPIPEKELLSYIIERDPLADRMGEAITYHDLTVEKRQTNKEEKQDRIWVRFQAETASDTAQATAYLEFTLYNDGWHFEWLDDLEATFQPKRGPDRETVVSCFPGTVYFQRESKQVNLDNGRAVLGFKVWRELDGKTEIGSVTIPFYYDELAYIPGWCPLQEPEWKLTPTSGNDSVETFFTGEARVWRKLEKGNDLESTFTVGTIEMEESAAEEEYWW